jgi:Leucine-rich repeat (LRR) protein
MHALRESSCDHECLTIEEIKRLCPAGALAELRSLDLSDNQLTGSLPAGLARPALKSVRLSNNLLAGENTHAS